MLSSTDIPARLDEVRARIAAAAHRAKRDPASIRLLLASKTQPPERIRAAYDAGAREFGENYVQEAASKRQALGVLEGSHWHLIGHLQTNKAKLAAELFEVIQTVDSERVATALMRAHPSGRVRALIEVNSGGESSKSGVAPADALRLLDSVRDQLAVLGLMTVPPVADARGARRYFAQLRELRDRLAGSSGLALSELSMGMTDDFEIAIEEGATMVRVGRAVFGERR
ncbi:MAG TPA: YggS family pyridoxal phosphate-dependent enzyme [Candidatus Binataceae bacterium]|nr:YggS family pyridoxal phosphate-dependent enzyme [Candidatus Binataceae bacterium]